MTCFDLRLQQRLTTSEPNVFPNGSKLCVVVAGPESSGTKVVAGLAAVMLGLKKKLKAIPKSIGDVKFRKKNHAIFHRILPYGFEVFEVLTLS